MCIFLWVHYGRHVKVKQSRSNKMSIENADYCFQLNMEHFVFYLLYIRSPDKAFKLIYCWLYLQNGDLEGHILNWRTSRWSINNWRTCFLKYMLHLTYYYYYQYLRSLWVKSWSIFLICWLIYNYTRYWWRIVHWTTFVNLMTFLNRNRLSECW